MTFTPPPLSILIADLGYGDAGKGSIIDYLARQTGAHTVVRYNGGAQAAHNVITPDGRHHTYSQFGSATFVPGVRTHLSRFMLLHPLAMLAEERHLRSVSVDDAFARTTIDRQALVITPFQQAANRLKELARGDARHGSCGMGIGETMSDALVLGQEALFAGDLSDHSALRRKLARIRDTKIAQLAPLLANLPIEGAIAEEWNVLHDPQAVEVTAEVFEYFARQVKIVEPEHLAGILRQPGAVLFEGAQGVLLDEWWGFYPYNSWSTLTFKNADTLLKEGQFSGETTRLGLIRGYATRHGAGPFVTENARLTQALPDAHNIENPWQGVFRAGWLDLVALRYALKVAGQVDGLVVSHLDRMEALPEWRICDAYHHPAAPSDLSAYFECSNGQVTGIKVPNDPTDLVHQESLTRLLMEMQPIEELCAHDRDPYLGRISQALHTPIAITSSGPTADAKEVWMGSHEPLRKVRSLAAFLGSKIMLGSYPRK